MAIFSHAFLDTISAIITHSEASGFDIFFKKKVGYPELRDWVM